MYVHIKSTLRKYKRTYVILKVYEQMRILLLLTVLLDVGRASHPINDVQLALNI